MVLSLEVEKMNLKRFPGGGGDFEKDCKIMELSLVNSDNERDSVLLNSNVILLSHCLLRGTGGFKPHEIEQ